ncbi:ABC-type antimicrobial peptide transport system permease subunit [Pedobacter cryoconitis]|uniref:ABC transporter permease n=1 Tax=Pedobacter cryoconitis TaxID=188932 RepID=UPI0016133278|nr:ABC transporter permease [Pedobacter cryoconitis]MBB6270067.1 ABC-type antimicrobial peptide transport system permease subunit [Pedobacter cryoconitis]
MFQHHLLLIYRNFKKYKSSFFINLVGLTAGLTCTLLIYLWVNDELRMDKFQEKGSQLYQVMENEKTEAGINTTDLTAGLLAEALLKEMPEVEDAVMVSPAYWIASSKLSVKNNTGIQGGGLFAGKNFFKVFSYPLISGNADQVLNNKNSIVISAQMAMKLFHSTDVVGKEVTWENSDMVNENHTLISGVFKDIPANSSGKFDFIVSIDPLMVPESGLRKWESHGPNTFVVLKKGADVEVFNSRIKNFMQSKGVDRRELFIRAYTDSYLYDKYENGKQAGGRIEYVKLFSLIAVFILIIACVNFMNLATARASVRMKEVGIKKVMGASRGSLMMQYMGEAIFLAFLSLFFSLLFVELLLPQFNEVTGKHLFLHFDLKLILALMGITIFTGLISGSYPALYLSGFNPAAALKGKISHSAGELWTRQGLVVFQFTLSVILIVSVLVVYKQIEFVQHTKAGYQKDNVLYIEAEGRLKTNAGTFITALKNIPDVVNASSMDKRFIGDLKGTVGDFNWEGRDPKQVIKFQFAGLNSGLIETMGMEMAGGRAFSSQFGADSTKVIINEAGIKVMGLKDPIGKIFTLWGKELQIIGVMKDVHFESMHEVIKPMFFLYNAKNTNRIMVKIKAGHEKNTVAAILRLYRDFNQGGNPNYKFLDQDFQEQYIAENRISLLSRYFAVLAIVISCLGLFGLASFTAARKLKEIGVRKVLGASEWGIIYSLSKDFIKPVMISILIALPLSYILTKYWLATFAYRIELQLWYFAGAGFLALLISWITVSVQAIKAGLKNPITCLRDE